MAAKKKALKKRGAKKSAARKPAAKKPAAKKGMPPDKWLVRSAPVAGEPAAVFTALRAILAKHQAALVVKFDKPGRYWLNTAKPNPRNKDEMFFGAAVIMKSYVSFHLMPVYAFPELVKSASPELRKRMQGKSCFNFKGMEPALFRELDAITREGLKRFKAVGLA